MLALAYYLHVKRHAAEIFRMQILLLRLQRDVAGAGECASERELSAPPKSLCVPRAMALHRYIILNHVAPALKSSQSKMNLK
jgi:hypothetical protein